MIARRGEQTNNLVGFQSPTGLPRTTPKRGYRTQESNCQKGNFPKLPRVTSEGNGRKKELQITSEEKSAECWSVGLTKKTNE